MSAGLQSGSRAVLVYGVFSVLGYPYGAIAARVGSAPEFVARTALTRIRPGRAALLGAAALGLAAYTALQANWVKPFWIPAAFLALLQMWFTTADNDRRRVLERLAATYIGMLLLVPFPHWVHPTAVGAAAVIALIVGMAVGSSSYWLSVALVTVAVGPATVGRYRGAALNRPRSSASRIPLLGIIVEHVRTHEIVKH